MFRVLLPLCLALVASFSLVNSCQALTISPTAADYSVLPGGLGEAVITLKNETVIDREYQVQFVQVTFDSLTGAPAFSPLTPSVAALFSADPALFTLLAGESLNVNLSFSAPPLAAATEYTVAALFIERSSMAGVSVGAGYAVMLFAQIGTQGTEAYQVLQFETPTAITTSLPVQFSVVLKNAGDRTVTPAATIQIRRSGQSQALAEIPVNPYGQRLPVATSRVFSTSWQPESQSFSRQSPYGSFEAVIVDAQGHLIDSLNPTIHFTIMPVRLVVIIVATILILIFGILLVRALHKRAAA